LGICCWKEFFSQGGLSIGQWEDHVSFKDTDIPMDGIIYGSLKRLGQIGFSCMFFFSLIWLKELLFRFVVASRGLVTAPEHLRKYFPLKEGAGESVSIHQVKLKRLSLY
jgi:hypothetical protein